MGWRHLSEQERADVYRRYKVDKEDLVDLAQELGIYVETLSRQLRKYAERTRNGGSNKKDNVDDAVEVYEEGNGKRLESKGLRITNLDELLAECDIDLDTWAVERHIVNKWEVGVKNDYGEIVVEPLFQVKAWLVLRNPVEITPVVKPVYINTSVSKPAQKRRGLKAALILPDTQFGFSRSIRSNKLFPFHDRLALDVVRQIAEDIEPDMTVYLGDVNDYSGWSDKFIRRPEFYFTTQPALIEASWSISQMRALTSGDVYVLEGNHDMRPETMLINHLLEAYQLSSGDNINAPHLLSIDNLLGLSRMGVIYVGDYPNGEVWINENTRCVHGDKVRGGSGQTVSALVKELGETTIFGHIHRKEMAVRTQRTRNGYKQVTAFSPGCLCHIDGRVPGSRADNNWQQGAAVVWYNDEISTIVPIDISDGKAVYNGELYVGTDYTPRLKKDTEWEF